MLFKIISRFNEENANKQNSHFYRIYVLKELGIHPFFTVMNDKDKKHIKDYFELNGGITIQENNCI